MDRTDCCILVCSTPKYYYILPLFFKLLRRYAASLRWDVILATEVPENPVCTFVASNYAVQLLPIPEESKGFLESRLAALRLVRNDYSYCLPLQDDFLLEMPMNDRAISSVLDYMDSKMGVVSARCMPCPGPSAEAPFVAVEGWKQLDAKTDAIGFTFQATLWKIGPLTAWYERVCARLEAMCPQRLGQTDRRREIEIKENIAENRDGQADFWRWSDEKDYDHIALERAGPWPNAVYLSPFPYRPTAIVGGRFEPWAQELARRETST
jgi:hypothetical protein